MPSAITSSDQRIRDGHRCVDLSCATQSQQPFGVKPRVVGRGQGLERLAVSTTLSQYLGMLVLRFLLPIWIPAVEQLHESRVGSYSIAGARLAPAICQPGLFSQIAGNLGCGHTTQRSQRLLTLSHARQGDSPEHLRLRSVLAAGVSNHDRLCLGRDLPPQPAALEGAPIALRLPCRTSQPIGIVHPVVVHTAPARGHSHHECYVLETNSHPPDSGVELVFRSYSRRYSTMASAKAEAIDFWLA